ncbi:MAG: nickel-dependent hydrogenase large subunit, partial [Chitinivibrionales bacterium]|nr:nickel-dependent hydrogenase large subunit [Chitinivibrionales bacterium]
MGKRTIIPFGPQHPVLPEPIHLTLAVEDERVVEVMPQIGFIHRGLEKLAEKREYPEMVYVAERICGICSCIHGHGYCEAIEAIMNVEVPVRGQLLRVIFDEISRIHSHLLWLGLLADSFGFESLFMHTWRIREKILDLVEETTGGRVIFGIHKIGGVRKDIDSEMLGRMIKELKVQQEECKTITSVFQKDGSVKKRQVGIGVLT